MCLKTRGQLFWVPDLLYLFLSRVPLLSFPCLRYLLHWLLGDPLGSTSHLMVEMLKLCLQLQNWTFPKDSKDPTQVKVARHPPLPAEPPHQHFCFETGSHCSSGATPKPNGQNLSFHRQIKFMLLIIFQKII